MADTDKKPLGQVKLVDVRLSFADIFQRAPDRTNDKGEVIKGKFKANFLMEKGTEATAANMAKCKAAANEVKTAKYGAEKNWPKYKPEKLFLRDGDLENWDGYEGAFYVSANSDDQPVLTDRVKDKDGKWLPIDSPNSGKLYSGCRVNAIVRIWVQDNEHGKRINAEVKAIQFRAHGEPFTGNMAVDPNAEGGFDDDDVGEDDLDVSERQEAESGEEESLI